jgi:hypothetical protein
MEREKEREKTGGGGKAAKTTTTTRNAKTNRDERDRSHQKSIWLRRRDIKELEAEHTISL